MGSDVTSVFTTMPDTTPVVLITGLTGGSTVVGTVSVFADVSTMSRWPARSSARWHRPGDARRVHPGPGRSNAATANGFIYDNMRTAAWGFHWQGRLASGATSTTQTCSVDVSAFATLLTAPRSRQAITVIRHRERSPHRDSVFVRVGRPPPNGSHTLRSSLATRVTRPQPLWAQSTEM
jgi:hypothetical protein